MAVETYSWRSQLGAGAIEYSQAVRAAQFGDGLLQPASARPDLGEQLPA
ncbi:hypothetical protein [Enterobacter kobei]